MGTTVNFGNEIEEQDNCKGRSLREKGNLAVPSRKR
jgi:hypothetical protein